jgi:class 3 adenylate cyclase
LSKSSPSSSAWFAAPHVSWAWALAACVLWSVALTAVFESEAGEYLEARVGRPLLFKARETLGQSVPVSDRLKIYALDDAAFGMLDSWVLTMEDWVAIFKTLDKNSPRAIVVDAMFSKDILGSERADFDAVKELAGLRTPVVVGSFLAPQAILNRQTLDLGRAEYQLKTMLKEGDEAGADAGLPPMVDRQGWVAYGPSTALQAGFRGIGHITYPGFGTVAPLMRLGDGVALGHIALYAAKERRIEDGRLLLDGAIVPIGPDGLATVNFPTPKAFYAATRSIRGLVQRARNGAESEVVHEGDVVLLLPLMYTGNSDFKQTPFGSHPAGYVVAAVINSVLSGTWLKPLSHDSALIALAAFAGAGLGVGFGAVAFWAALLGALALALAVAAYLFAFAGIVVPWLFPTFALFATGVTVFAEKMRVSERKAQRLRAALEGAVPQDDLKELLKRPEAINLEARERVVTLMFIDVVGFSLLAENMLPRMAFENLKRMLSTIGDTVHGFGGIIDKTLGDGLLCYFGYRFDEDQSSPDHAEKALRCAIRIQEENLKRNLEAAANGEPVYPLRIGINTSSCYLGDLGSANRIDFTVVGNGVNFAKRLEGACEMHSILIGATTNDLVRGIGLAGEAFTRRFIRIKHHSELVEAYEYDPFLAEPGLRQAALEGFRKCANIERVDQRWPVHDPTKIQLVCDFGEGQLVNFSHTGLSIRLKQLLAKGTRLSLTLDSASGQLRALLSKDGMDTLQGEVRWGYADGAEFVHGVMLTNVPEEKSDQLVQYLCEFAFSRETRRAAGGP